MKILNKIQTRLAITRQELLIVTIVLFGLILGIILKQNPPENLENHNNITQILDSIANREVVDKQKNDTLLVHGSEKIYGNNSINKTEKNTQKKVIPVLNINTASKSDLELLPGVGPKTAEKIIEYRTKQKFNKPSDIKKVKGIGEKKFDKMKKYIEVR